MVFIFHGFEGRQKRHFGYFSGKDQRITERIDAGSVKILVKPIRGRIVALTLAVSWTPFNLWAQQSEAELLNQAHVTKHQAKRIALARVKHGTIKTVELQKESGVLIWSVDVAQPGKKDLTDVWVDATTGKITAVEVETPLIEKKEVAENRVKKWLSRH
jgi:uncharacterized membrane protein YkoI